MATMLCAVSRIFNKPYNEELYISPDIIGTAGLDDIETG